MFSAYPLLRHAGGFKIMRCGRSRALTQIPVPNSGYSMKFLQSESSLNKALAYIVPLQQAIYIEPEDSEVKVCYRISCAIALHAVKCEYSFKIIWDLQHSSGPH